MLYAREKEGESAQVLVCLWSWNRPHRGGLGERYGVWEGSKKARLPIRGCPGLYQGLGGWSVPSRVYSRALELVVGRRPLQ